MNTGTHLLVVSLAVAFVAGLFIGLDFAVDGEAGTASAMGWVLAAIASPIWIVGLIAVGLRIGIRDAER